MSDKLTDKLVGGGVKPELSPNPNGSGYTKQVEVDSLLSIDNPEVNVLYICQGRKYKYAHAIIDPGTNKILVPAGFVRVENGPQVHNVDGGRGTPVHENVHPQVPPRVFNEPVALNGGVTIKGKKLEDYIDSEGGVTEEELANTLALYAKKVDTASKYVVSDLDAIPSATIALLKAGDVILVETGGIGDVPLIYDTWIVTGKQEEGICLITSATGTAIETICYSYEDGAWVRDSDEDVTFTGDSTKLYLHHVKTNESFKAIVEITNTSNVPFTSDTLAQWLYNKGFTSITNYYTATATLRYVSSDDNIYFVKGIISNNGTSLKLITSTINKTTLSTDSNETSISASSLTDTVIEM